MARHQLTVRTATTRTGGAVLLTALALGCAARSPHDRASISDSLRDRSGHPLRPAAGTGEALPAGVALADGLSEDEAVAVALWNNAELEATLAELGMARADLLEAGLIRNPVFSLLFPLGPKQLEFTLTWPLESLWQRPKRVAAAQADVGKTAARLVQSGLSLVRTVRVAHAELLLAEERVRLAQETRDVRGRIAEIADARLRLGDLSPLEAATTRIDAARAEDDASRAAHDAELSRQRLVSLVGLGSDGPAVTLTPAPLPSSGPVPELPVLLKEALAARPELRAAELGMEAAAKRAGLARSDILTLSALLDANGSGSEGVEMGPGIALELPLFGRHKGRLARAQAELELEARRYVAARERIVLDVRQARTALLSARESLAVWESRVVPAFAESLARVVESQTSGEASLLDVLAARRSLLDARLLEAQAQMAVRRAEADLGYGVGKALGRLSPTESAAEAHP